MSACALAPVGLHETDSLHGKIYHTRNTPSTRGDLRDEITLTSGSGRISRLDAGVQHLRNLPALHNLDLGETLITDEALQHVGSLTELKSLRLNWNVITDAGLQHLTGLKKLRWLEVDGTLLTDAASWGITSFCPSHPKVALCKLN